MKKKTIHILMFLLAVWAAVSCVYDYNPQIDGEGGYLVVEGNLVIGDVCDITTRWSWSLVDTTQEEESWRILASNRMHVEASDGTRYPDLRVAEFGIGGSASGLFDLREADPSLEYRLVINNVKGTYVSEWTKPLDPGRIDSLSWRINEDRTMMDILVASHAGEEGGSYYKWTVSETWEYNADVFAVFTYDYINSLQPLPNSENIYHCWSSGRRPEIFLASTTDLREDRLIDHYLYAISNRDERISVLYAADVTQMRIPKEAWQYWQTMQRNSENVGGLFSPEPSELRGNLVNVDNPEELVLGYVGVMSVTTRRLYVDNTETYFYRSARPRVSPTDTLNTEEEWMAAFMLGKLPVDEVWGEDNREEIIGYSWYPAYCVDCRMRGGTKKKPEGWPNGDV